MERIKIERNVIITKKELKEMQDEVFSNLKAIKYLTNLGLTETQINENIDKVYDFACDMKNCAGCKGIKFCNKDPRFLVNSVSYKNGFIERTITPCKKYLEHVNFKNKLLQYDFPEEWLDNYINKDISNIKAIAQQTVLKKYAFALQGKSSEWVFLKGDIASGKSFMAATLCADAARNDAFSSIAFINVPSKFKQLSDLAFQKNPLFNSEIEKLQNVEMLVLDDFGNEFKSDFVRDNILYPILSMRVKNKKFTIITGNYSIDDCADMYHTNNASKPKIEQIRNMLKLMCVKEIILASPSLR